MFQASRAKGHFLDWGNHSDIVPELRTGEVSSQALILSNLTQTREGLGQVPSPGQVSRGPGQAWICR